MSSAPLYCPSWEYADIDGYASLLASRNREALRVIRQSNRSKKISIAGETRPFHRAFFADLTPAQFDYYAGNYRGSNFPCLLYSNVGVQGDGKVGHPAGTINLEMLSFVRFLHAAISNIEQLRSASSLLISDEEKLFRTIDIAASIFVYFLEIHPYVNGNGHVGRLLLICILGVFDIYPLKWSIDPRPPDPPYTGAIVDYRNGNRKPLVHFILSCL